MEGIFEVGKKRKEKIKYLPMNTKGFLSSGVLLVLFATLILSTNASVIRNFDLRKTAVQTDSPFQKLATFKAVGLVISSLVGPGATPGNQIYYLGYKYFGSPFDLVAIDPNNNYSVSVYSSPITSEESPSSLITGPDGNIYIGTNPNAHLIKFDPVSKQMTDIGTIRQNAISQLSVSAYDRKIYGCTYPSAHLFSYNPLEADAKLVDLDSVDQLNMYARFCVTDPDPKNPYVYIGTGTVSQKIVAYNIKTKTTAVLTSESIAGQSKVWVSNDNKTYGNIRETIYWLNNGTATITTNRPTPVATNILTNGDTISINGDSKSILVKHPGQNTSVSYPFPYQGKNSSIFRLGLGPNGNIYLSSMFPFYLIRYDPSHPEKGLVNLGQFGNGEAYSFLTYQQRLLIAAYASSSVLMSYDPNSPINPSPSPFTCSNNQPLANPICIQPAFISTLRGTAIITTPDGKAYFGSAGAYGELTGYLVKMKLSDYTGTIFKPFTDVGISSLVVANKCKGVTQSNYCIVGSSTTTGGGGTRADPDNQAQIFIWDPVAEKVVAQYDIPEDPKVQNITNLIVNPVNNYVYGMSIDERTLFVFDPAQGIFVKTNVSLPFTLTETTLYNTVTMGSDGNIWGIGKEGIFTIDSKTDEVRIVATPPAPIEAGFALVKDGVNGDKIYYASDGDLYVYNLPPNQSIKKFLLRMLSQWLK